MNFHHELHKSNELHGCPVSTPLSKLKTKKGKPHSENEVKLPIVAFLTQRGGNRHSYSVILRTRRIGRAVNRLATLAYVEPAVEYKPCVCSELSLSGVLDQ